MSRKLKVGKGKRHELVLLLLLLNNLHVAAIKWDFVYRTFCRRGLGNGDNSVSDDDDWPVSS